MMPKNVPLRLVWIGAVCLVLVLPANAIHGSHTLDLSYDPDTGGLTIAPGEFHRLEIASAGGLFTGPPSVAVTEFFEGYLSVFPRSAEPLALGSVLPTGLTFDDLSQDLCVEAVRDYQQWNPPVLYDVVRLNGQVLHAEPVSCSRPPRVFPPFSGERTGILQYESATGDLRLRSQTPITALNINSTSELFTGTAREGVFVSWIDVNRPDKLFKLENAGMVSLDYGPIMEPGLTNNEFLSDICISGAWLGGGYVDLDYAYPNAGTVPIPTCDGNSRPAEVEIKVEYNTTNGEVAIRAADLLTPPVPPGAAAAEEAMLMTTLDMRSSSGIFTGGTTQNLDGPYDQQSPFRILKQDREGFASVNFGPILAKGLTQEFVEQDVTLDVTFFNRSTLRGVEVVTVPEPSGFVWLLAATGLMARVRRRRT